MKALHIDTQGEADWLPTERGRRVPGRAPPLIASASGCGAANHKRGWPLGAWMAPERGRQLQTVA